MRVSARIGEVTKLWGWWNDPCNLPPDIAPRHKEVKIVPPPKPKQRGSVDKTGEATRARLRRVLIKKYGPFCWLCGKPIDLTIKHPDPWSFSRDHVIPRSKGGTDAIRNQRPAHRICNQKRGNKPAPEEL